MAETVTHRNPDSKWLFDYTSLEAMDDCPENLVLLSERDINLIWQAVLNIDRFRSRVFTNRDGETYTIADLDQWGDFREWVSDMNVNMGDYMACNGVLEGILAAIQAIADRPCCPTGSPGSGVFNAGSRGAGITRAVPSTYEETELETPPGGFDTWEEYREHKCNAASDIVLHLKVDLLSLSNLQLSAGGYSALIALIVGVLLTPVPFDDIAAIVSLLLVAAIEISWMTSLSAEVQNDADDLKCVLYNASDFNDAEASFRSAVGGLITSLDLGTFASGWLNDLVVALTPPDSLNKLFTAGPTETQDANCEDCGSGLCELGLTNGDVVSGTLDGGPVTLSSVSVDWNGDPEDPRHIISVIGDFCCWSLTDFSTDAPDIQHWGEAVDAGCGPSDIGFFQDGNPPLDFCLNSLYMFPNGTSFDTPFQVTLTWESCGE